MIKIIIYQWFFESRFNIIGEFVSFSPVFNTKLSWFNSLFDFGIGYLPHFILSILAIILAAYIYKYGKSKYRVNAIVTQSYIFFMAGAWCKLIDIVFWPGSLDYIRLKGLFIFDLKDVFLTTSGILFVVFFFIPYALKHPPVLKMNVKQDILIMKDFFKYVYQDIFKPKSGQNHTTGR